LNELTPTEDKLGGRDISRITISKTPYAHGLGIGCRGTRLYQAYNVAGDSYVSAMLGIPDNVAGNFRGAADIVLSDQNGTQLGSPVSVSFGHPVQITRLPLRGAAQLKIACNGRDLRTGRPLNGFRVALGDARIE
jgi:hypothetical protein